MLWLDKGSIRGLGDTESVLANYETHVRSQDGALPCATKAAFAGASDASVSADVQLAMTGDRRASLLGARIRGHDDVHGTGAVIEVDASDLVIEISVVSTDDECPSVGVMLEQFHGVGIASVATHADGVQLKTLESRNGLTTWATTLTFENLPLHSGQYCLSFYLFDAKGLVVYDEWKDFIRFQWTSYSLTPGLVHLPHQWS